MSPETQIATRRRRRLASAFVRLLAPALFVAVGPAIAQETVHGDLVVFAAASLHEAFVDLGGEFSAENPGTTLTFNFAGSQQLAEQIREGAPADVFASASPEAMRSAGERIESASVRLFACNRLVVVVPNVSGRIVRSLRDLAHREAKIVIAHRSVPAGEYAIRFLARCDSSGEFGPGFSGAVLARVVSYEENVRAVLSKIMLDEADAGIVYASDAGGGSGRSLSAIDIPDRLNVIAAYPAGCTRDSKNGKAAGRFIAFLLSGAGQRILTRAGFMGTDPGAPGTPGDRR